jgi:membrane associated rhomboid family serine protease
MTSPTDPTRGPEPSFGDPRAIGQPEQPYGGYPQYGGYQGQPPQYGGPQPQPGYTYPGGYPQSGGVAPVGETCAFHPNRSTQLHCSRCGRPACPDCLTPASVGFQCRACVAEGRPVAARNLAGARMNEQPLFTWMLIALNVVIFVICVVQARNIGDDTGSDWFYRGTLIPAAVALGEWWRVVTSGFLHLGIVHVAANMFSLYIIGLPLERLLGRVRFLVVYLLSLLGGSLSVMLFAPAVSSAAGASGAIFGLMGALVVTFRRFKFSLQQLVGVLAINLIITFVVSGISWQAHLGGLVVGAGVAALMVHPPRARRTLVQVGGSIAVLVVLVAGLWLRADSIRNDQCGDIQGTFYCRPN